MRDLYQTVTDRIVAALETGTAPWAKPYSQAKFGAMPCNAVTNRPYSGINVLLYFISKAESFSSPRFLTFKQAKDAGGFVKKGQKGFPLYFFKPMVKEEDGEEKKFAILREYTVFNVDQCENLPDHIRFGRKVDVTPKNQEQRNADADAFIKATGASFKERKGMEPMYVPSIDKVLMPSWEEFHGSIQFYDVAFHELSHWTGHESRLNRNLNNRFGTKAYAAEELIAQLSAAFLDAEFGFDCVDTSASYIASWIELLKEDKRAIFKAASEAQKAADYLRGKALEEVVSEEEKEAA